MTRNGNAREYLAQPVSGFAPPRHRRAARHRASGIMASEWRSNMRPGPQSARSWASITNLFAQGGGRSVGTPSLLSPKRITVSVSPSVQIAMHVARAPRRPKRLPLFLKRFPVLHAQLIDRALRGVDQRLAIGRREDSLTDERLHL